MNAERNIITEKENSTLSEISSNMDLVINQILGMANQISAFLCARESVSEENMEKPSCFIEDEKARLEKLATILSTLGEICVRLGCI